METMRNLEKDWWGYGKDSGTAIRDSERRGMSDGRVKAR